MKKILVGTMALMMATFAFAGPQAPSSNPTGQPGEMQTVGKTKGKHGKMGHGKKHKNSKMAPITQLLK